MKWMIDLNVSSVRINLGIVQLNLITYHMQRVLRYSGVCSRLSQNQYRIHRLQIVISMN